MAKSAVLPWEPGEAEKAAATCFKDWLASRGGQDPAELQEGFRQVQLFLEQHGSSRFEDVASMEGHRPLINRGLLTQAGERLGLSGLAGSLA